MFKIEPILLYSLFFFLVKFSIACNNSPDETTFLEVPLHLMTDIPKSLSCLTWAKFLAASIDLGQLIEVIIDFGVRYLKFNSLRLRVVKKYARSLT